MLLYNDKLSPNIPQSSVKNIRIYFNIQFETTKF